MLLIALWVVAAHAALSGSVLQGWTVNAVQTEKLGMQFGADGVLRMNTEPASKRVSDGRC